MREFPLQAAPVWVDVPLISNQEVYMNIALIKKYHDNMPRQEAWRLAVDCLGKIGLEHIAYKRNPVLTSEERFGVMLLRAAMVQAAMILIVKPFELIPHLNDIQMVTSMLKTIDELYVSCHIYDYQWMQEKYGDL
jgi:ABC-type nitrate/sulfonate/bicarbonate transport system ATPase subunit